MKLLIVVWMGIVFLNGCTSFCTKSYKKRSVNFSKEMELTVFKKATATDNPNVRFDVCGREIHYDQYGKRNSRYCWEIDHIKPKSKCGGDKIKNLQPLYCKTNRKKSDRWPAEAKDYCPQNK